MIDPTDHEEISEATVPQTPPAAFEGALEQPNSQSGGLAQIEERLRWHLAQADGLRREAATRLADELNASQATFATILETLQLLHKQVGHEAAKAQLAVAVQQARWLARSIKSIGRTESQARIEMPEGSAIDRRRNSSTETAPAVVPRLAAYDDRTRRRKVAPPPDPSDPIWAAINGTPMAPAAPHEAIDPPAGEGAPDGLA